MTEEEAKKKWCPMARLSIMDQPIDGTPQPKERCIASRCMMWQEQYSTWIVSKESFAEPGEAFSPDDYEERINGGCCGLTK